MTQDVHAICMANNMLLLFDSSRYEWHACITTFVRAFLSKKDRDYMNVSWSMMQYGMSGEKLLAPLSRLMHLDTRFGCAYL